MTDALSGTPEFSWRGVEYPLTRLAHGFTHQQASTLIYSKGEFLEQLGPKVLWCKCTIPMRDGIIVGSHEKLFSNGLQTLFDDVLNPEPGDLVDPIYGDLVMLPSSFSDNVDPQKRDGLDVDLEFKVYQELDEALELIGPSIAGLGGDTTRLDAEVEAVARAAQVSPPQPATDPLSAIAGVGAQLQRNRDRVQSSLAGVSAKLRKIENQVDALEDPLNGDVIREARRLQVDAARLSAKAEPGRVSRQLVTNTSKSVVVVARALGMTVSELLSMNPSLAKSPTIPAGSSVSYYG